MIDLIQLTSAELSGSFLLLGASAILFAQKIGCIRSASDSVNTVCMGRVVMGRVCVGRLCYGPSLQWAEFAMGRDVHLPHDRLDIVSPYGICPRFQVGKTDM